MTATQQSNPTYLNSLKKLHLLFFAGATAVCALVYLASYALRGQPPSGINVQSNTFYTLLIIWIVLAVGLPFMRRFATPREDTLPAKLSRYRSLLLFDYILRSVFCLCMIIAFIITGTDTYLIFAAGMLFNLLALLPTSLRIQRELKLNEEELQQLYVAR